MCRIGQHMALIPCQPDSRDAKRPLFTLAFLRLAQPWPRKAEASARSKQARRPHLSELASKLRPRCYCLNPQCLWRASGSGQRAKELVSKLLLF